MCAVQGVCVCVCVCVCVLGGGGEKGKTTETYIVDFHKPV